MPFSGMLGYVAFVRTNVPEEHITFIVRVAKIGKLGTMLAVISNQNSISLQHASVVSYC
jgi:hypothetical protein